MYAVMIGSNMFIGTNGIMNIEIEGKSKEFFKVREIFRERAEGSYLAVDCDIKDSSNNREVKLFKSRPIAGDESINVERTNKEVIIKRADGSIVIRVEQLSPNDESLPKDGPIPELLQNTQIEAILRITGEFTAGIFNVYSDNNTTKIMNTVSGGTMQLGGNLSVATGGIRLDSMGFSM